MLSRRGQKYATISHAHGPKSFYDPVTNPEGPVDFSNAENVLLNGRLTEFFNANAHFDPELCTYGEGFTGSLRMRTAMATHLNEYFQPDTTFDAEEFTFISGVTALNEAIAFVTCDHSDPPPPGEKYNPGTSKPRDAILVGSSIYGSFRKDLTTRTGVALEYAAFGDADQFSTACIEGYNTAYDGAARHGCTIKALLICNPHNPLGQCYPPNTLRAIANFCKEKEIHLISDEIYALTTYQRPDRYSETFHSVYSVGVDPDFLSSNVHIEYGMAKDYGAPGLRVGCLISRNKGFTDAVRAAASRFATPSHYAISLCATLLEDRTFTAKFIHDSRAALQKSRLHAEGLLREAGIPFHDKGNSGMFIWMDLYEYLPFFKGTDHNLWDAEQKLLNTFKENGVLLASGRAYAAERPGRFRLLHGFPDAYVKKGITRIARTLIEVMRE